VTSTQTATRQVAPEAPASRRALVESLQVTLAALGCLGEASAHVPVMESHLVEAPYVGVGFVLLVIAGLYLAVRLIVGPDELVWAGCGLVATVAVVGYVLSRSVGLPQLGDDVGAWWDPLGITAVSCELATIAAVVGHYATRRVHI